MTPLKYATIMSGLVVRWTFPKPGYFSAEVNASRDGVSICGSWPIMQPKAIADLVTVLGSAVSVHERLKEGDELPEIPSAHMFNDPEPLNEPISRQARERDLDDE